MKEFNQHPKKQSLVIKLCGVHMGGGGGVSFKKCKTKTLLLFLKDWREGSGTQHNMKH